MTDPSPPLSARQLAKANKARAKELDRAEAAGAQAAAVQYKAAALAVNGEADKVKERQRRDHPMLARFFPYSATDEALYKYQGTTVWDGQRIGSLRGVTAVVDQGETHARVTATRILAIGVFALAAQKKSSDPSYLTITGPEVAVFLPIHQTQVGEARAFAVKINQLALAAAG